MTEKLPQFGGPAPPRHRPAGALAVLLLLALFLPGCGPEAEREGHVIEAGRRPNVLLVSLDTLRADRLGSYGYPRATSPFLDQLAGEGIRFENAFVNTHGTPPSHATLFSSLYQETHRVSFGGKEAGRTRHGLPPEIELLPERLQAAGYRTLAVTGGGYLSEDFGFHRGFDRFVEEPDIESQVDRLVAELSHVDRGPVFAFLHTYEIHSPYDPPPEVRGQLVRQERDYEATSDNLRGHGRDPEKTLDPAGLQFVGDLYDAGIRHTDDQLRRLFGRLDRLGFFDHHLTIIGSDHGEALGERGLLLHPATLFDELVRVPLVVVGTHVRRGEVRARLASTIDVAPTIYAATGVDPPPIMEGNDLLSPRAADDDGVVFSQYADHVYSVRTKRFKLVRDRDGQGEERLRLFDLREDPGERHDLAERRPRIVASLQAKLDAWLDRLDRLEQVGGFDGELDAERIEQLRALGYVD